MTGVTCPLPWIELPCCLPLRPLGTNGYFRYKPFPSAAKVFLKIWTKPWDYRLRKKLCTEILVKVVLKTWNKFFFHETLFDFSLSLVIWSCQYSKITLGYNLQKKMWIQYVSHLPTNHGPQYSLSLSPTKGTRWILLAASSSTF